MIVNQGSKSSDYVRELERVAIDVVSHAANFVWHRRRELLATPDGVAYAGSDAALRLGKKTKSSVSDPVTLVDVECETLVRDDLRLKRPLDAVQGEEEGGEEGADVTWVVDPIDGTVNFLYGLPNYAVSLAAQKDGESIAGAVVDVEKGIVYCAAKGSGARQARLNFDRDSGSKSVIGQFRPLRCSDPDELATTLVATGFAYSAEYRKLQGHILAGLLSSVRDIRRFGSAALDLCMVASGQVDAYYEHGLQLWDCAAGVLIAREAGAIVEQPDGTRVPGALTLASAPSVAKGLMDELGKLNALDPLWQ